MKISESWLREWVSPKIDSDALMRQLTMAGLEVEGVEKHGDDTLIEINLTPNRGDCLSVLGVAREVAALNGERLKAVDQKAIPAQIQDVVKVEIQAADRCPRYCGRVIKGINSNATTPPWMAARLEKSDIRLIHPVVDILNYVMIEIGQPMHAFDLSKISAGIQVRLAKGAEKLTLLDNQELSINANTLVIASNDPVAVAGIMGGLDSGVTTQTRDIFLESALFTADKIAGIARQYGLHTDSSYRFERGVDTELQALAMERATQYIVEICQGQVGPLITVEDQKTLPQAKSIKLRLNRLEQVLGEPLSATQVESILHQLGCDILSKTAEDFTVKPGTYRLDITQEVDLIEEIIRLFGYDNVKPTLPSLHMRFIPQSEQRVDVKRVKQALVDLGFQEVITYSFVDSTIQAQLFPSEVGLDLLNPIAQNMNQMRLSLWPGLLQTLKYNQDRQQHRLKCFEVGLCFNHPNDLVQEKYVAGLITGSRHPEGWSNPKAAFDFFDLKSALEQLWTLLGHAEGLEYKVETHSALHPSQSAQIVWQGKPMGWIGALHPALEKSLDVQGPVFMFEVKAELLTSKPVPVYQRLSKFPEIRRDIAVIVDSNLLTEQLMSVVRAKGGEWLQDVIVFDVYSGKGIDSGRKSVAMGLILQHASRTLVDDEVNKLMDNIVQALQKDFGAQLRE